MTNDSPGGMITHATDVDGYRARRLAEAMATEDHDTFDAVFDSAMDDPDRSPYDSMRGLVEALTSSALSHYIDAINAHARNANETYEAQLRALRGA